MMIFLSECKIDLMEGRKGLKSNLNDTLAPRMKPIWTSMRLGPFEVFWASKDQESKPICCQLNEHPNPTSYFTSMNMWMPLWRQHGRKSIQNGRPGHLSLLGTELESPRIEGFPWLVLLILGWVWADFGTVLNSNRSEISGWNHFIKSVNVWADWK